MDHARLDGRQIGSMAVVVQTMIRAILVSRRFRHAALLAALLGLAIGAYQATPFVEMLVLFSSIVGSHNVVEDSIANQRGDKVKASTEASGNEQDPDRTVVWLWRAHHWFATTLLETESYGFSWDAKWRNDDTLDLNIGFGCVTHMTRPVGKVGSIRISYHFGYDDKTLAKGCPN